MWVRKNIIEIIKDYVMHLKIAALSSILLFVFLFVFTTLTSHLGCEHHSVHSVLTINQTLERIPSYLLEALIISILFIFISYFFHPGEIRCNLCSKLKEKTDRKKCICGGKFINAKYYKFIK